MNGASEMREMSEVRMKMVCERGSIINFVHRCNKEYISVDVYVPSRQLRGEVLQWDILQARPL